MAPSIIPVRSAVRILREIHRYVVFVSLSKRREPPGAYPTHLVGWITNRVRQVRPRLARRPDATTSRYVTLRHATHALAFVFLQRGVQKLVSNPTTVQSAVMWGGAIGCGALWLTQPFDYIKSVLTSKPDADQ